MTGVQTSVLSRLRAAAALEAHPATKALDLLTGFWDQPLGLFARRAQTAPRPTNARRERKARTIYLDEQAEADLQYLLGELRRELGRASRSEGVRRALRAARLAMESRRAPEG